MRVILFLSVCVITLALPSPRRLRPEEHWRKAEPRDLSKYKPRAIWVNTDTGEDSWNRERVKINKMAPKHKKYMDISSNSNKTKSTRAVCGEEGPPAKDRIVGGEEAAPNQWPWMVAIIIDDSWFCGGSIISENFVLTAAHCAKNAEFFTVLAGVHKYRDETEPHRMEITSYNGWIHPEWDHPVFSHDLALIQLPEPIIFNDYIKPVCLPEKDDTANGGDLATATGWGVYSDSEGQLSDVLRMAQNLPIMSNEECRKTFGLVGDGMVCTDTTGGHGPCQGDSGGPLVTKVTYFEGPGQIWEQHGIVSFGSADGCEVGKPQVFTRVEHYIDWINSQIS